MDKLIHPIVERELDHPPENIARADTGLLHETYRIDCDGQSYVLQFASETDEDRLDSLARGVACYDLLGDTAVPVPEVVSDHVATFQECRYTLVETVPGEVGERAITPDRTRNAGRHLARIHDAMPVETTGWLQPFDSGDDGDAAVGLAVEPFEQSSLQALLREQIRRDAEVFRDGGLGGLADDLEATFDDADWVDPHPRQPVLCHNDYSPDNVLFCGGKVTGIIDFDRAIASHPQRDLAKAAIIFWMHDPTADWPVHETFYEGYRAVATRLDTFEGINPVAGSFERNEPRYRAEALATSVAGLFELGELTDHERAFYPDRIREALDRL